MDTAVDAARTDDGGTVDATGSVCTADADCDDHTFCNGAERCAPTDPGANARGCTAPGSPCAATQTCDEAAMRCATTCGTAPDADGDGARAIACGGDDCDDADPNRFPGRPEVCDIAGHDEDCDPHTFGVRDADGDGEADALCCNVEADGTTTHCGTDCDDTRSGVSPLAPEVCNGRDDDCDVATDEGVLITYYVDADMDGHGTSDASVPSITACTPQAGYATTNNDCNDAASGVNPGVGEVCDAAMVDENCNGMQNEDCTCTVGASRPCTAMGLCASGTEPCSASGTWGSCSIAAAPEDCNGLDDDCDGMVDDGVRVTCYIDADNDGYATSGAAPSDQCPVASRPAAGGCPVDYTNRAPIAPNEDCNDSDSSVSPTAFEICDMRDNDCNSMIDDGVGVICFVDADGDTFATLGAPPVGLCPVVGRPEVGGCMVGYTNRMPMGSSSADCNDAVLSTHPGALEPCDGVDNDCTGVVDDGMTVQCWGDGDDDSYAAAGTPGSLVCPVPSRTAVGGCPINMTNRDPAVAGQSDCVDSNRDIHPGAIELCDGIDNDCNGTDDAMRVLCYADMDDDTYAPAGTAASMQCPDAARMSVAFCPGRFTDRAPISVATSDCADANASVNPSITEMCQVPAFDQNCNGNADEGYVVCFLDADGDGFAATGAMTLASACPLMGGYGGCGTGYTSRNPATAGNADCADADAARNPLASELCSTTYDDDCDGMANEAPVLRNLYIDRDGDGYAGGPAMPMLLTCCTSTCVPAGYRTTGNDCNDRDAVVHPGVSTYYTTPYARCADASAFRCMPTTTWRCSADSTCDDSDPAAPMSFDYDCSGGEDAQPFADGMACTGSCFVNTPRVCRDSISSTQPCYSGVFPGCGGSTPTCRCDTSDGSLCTSAAECPGSYTAGLYNMQLGCR